jgi:ADP-heptose:LPS heptosyltransferase
VRLCAIVGERAKRRWAWAGTLGALPPKERKKKALNPTSQIAKAYPVMQYKEKIKQL